MTLWYALVAGFIIAIGALIARRSILRRGGESVVGRTSASTLTRPANSTARRNDDNASIAFRTAAIVDAQMQIYKLAFGVARTDYEILGDHRKVLTAIEDSIKDVVGEARHFPRRPALLPKLLRAINTVSSGRKEIVRLILQDAVLAGNVLQRANSAYYNAGKEVIESIDRAVTILGNEGLRAPVASAVMQPVFQLPAGFFEQFAPITWEQARRTAVAAEEFARVNRSADTFVAHLAGMLEGLGRIVLFRLTMDKYREHRNIMPRAEVFIQVMATHSRNVARAIAAAWEMSPPFLEALDAQALETAPERMTPLARTLYYANLCGTCATLNRHGSMTEEHAQELLIKQGLDNESVGALWKVATQEDLT